jgi:hypothetical protein
VFFRVFSWLILKIVSASELVRFSARKIDVAGNLRAPEARFFLSSRVVVRGLFVFVVKSKFL